MSVLVNIHFKKSIKNYTNNVFKRVRFQKYL